MTGRHGRPPRRTMTRANYSIGTKIFGAFAAMSVIIAALGLAAYGVLSSAGQMAITTFDGPLMAINYARAAQSDFIGLKMAELRLETAPAGQRAMIATEIEDLSHTFGEDMAVAQRQSFEEDEQRVIRQIKGLMVQWHAAQAVHDAPRLDRLDAQIDEKFDLLIELNTDHAFVGRRQTGSAVDDYKYGIAAAIALALALTGGITLFLRRRIVRPLTDAADVAGRIALGELETSAASGSEETT